MATAVLVMAGGSTVGATEELLRSRAVAWAQDVAPAAVQMSDQPVPAAIAGAFADGAGPLLLAWPNLPRWRADHAEGALADLAEGCDLSVGPVFDGALYLLALARPLPGVPDEAWDTSDAMAAVLTAALQAQFGVGLLRAERGIRTAADVPAALADPLLDPELRAVLG